jgi:hypothetical protein
MQQENTYFHLSPMLNSTWRREIHKSSYIFKSYSYYQHNFQTIKIPEKHDNKQRNKIQIYENTQF